MRYQLKKKNNKNLIFLVTYNNQSFSKQIGEVKILASPFTHPYNPQIPWENSIFPDPGPISENRYNPAQTGTANNWK